MRILVSMKGDLVGLGLAEMLGREDRVTSVDIASDVSSIIDALCRERYGIHLVGSSCLGLAREVGRTMKADSSAAFVADERVLLAIEHNAVQTLEARRLGFSRIVGPSADLVDRLLAPVGSAIWFRDSIDEIPLGQGANAPRIGDVCRDETDRRILVLLTQGMSDSDIAEKIHYGVQSVRNRVSRMLHRSGFRNRTELAVKMLTRSDR